MGAGSPLYEVVVRWDFYVRDKKGSTLEGFAFVYQRMHGPKFEVLDAESANLLRERVEKGGVES